MLREFLTQEGYQVQAAADGPEALALLRRQAFDLLLIDFRLAGMTGLELLQEAKKLDPEIEAIMMTAYATIAAAVAAIKAGTQDYLIKPIDLDELLLLIHRLAQYLTMLRENKILRQELQTQRVETTAII